MARTRTTFHSAPPGRSTPRWSGQRRVRVRRTRSSWSQCPRRRAERAVHAGCRALKGDPAAEAGYRPDWWRVGWQGDSAREPGQPPANSREWPRRRWRGPQRRPPPRPNDANFQSSRVAPVQLHSSSAFPAETLADKFDCFPRETRHDGRNGPRMFPFSAVHYQQNRVARRHTQTDD